MQRIEKLNSATAPQETKTILENVKAKLGGVPAILQTMANSPAALNGYLGIMGALSEGKLSAKLGEQIAVTIAGVNCCDYCASAHTAIGQKHGLTKDELSENLKGNSTDPKTKAALDFVRTIVAKRGLISEIDLQAIRRADYTEEEIVELIAHTAMNIFTNYFNHIAETEIDFPLIKTA